MPRLSRRLTGTGFRVVRLAMLLLSPLLLASASLGEGSTAGSCRTAHGSGPAWVATDDEVAHGGGLNACGCHFNRKTGECHCHQARGCGCACQPPSCPR